MLFQRANAGIARRSERTDITPEHPSLASLRVPEATVLLRSTEPSHSVHNPRWDVRLLAMDSEEFASWLLG